MRKILLTLIAVAALVLGPALAANAADATVTNYGSKYLCGTSNGYSGAVCWAPGQRAYGIDYLRTTRGQWLEISGVSLTQCNAATCYRSVYGVRGARVL